MLLVCLINIAAPGDADPFAEIKVRNIEIATQVPKKFRFPMFSRYVEPWQA